MIYLLAVLFSLPIIVFTVMFLFYRKKSKNDNNVNDELDEIVKYCIKIESNMDKGLAVFTPNKEDEYLYEVLVEMGVMAKNPLGGYSLKDALDRTWGKIPKSFCSVEKDRYQDHDGVLQVFLDDEGNVKKIVREEDLRENPATTNNLATTNTNDEAKKG